MLISLCHIPSAERLVCVVICGKELKESLNNTSILNKDISKFILTSFFNFKLDLTFTWIFHKNFF